MRCSLRALLPVLFAALLVTDIAFATPFTASDKTRITAMEAAVFAAADLVQLFGVLPSILTFDAIFDDTSWSMTMGGLYGGIPLSLSFSGQFDSVTNTGSNTAVGAFGAETWSGSGSWAFTDIDDSTIGLTGGTDTELGPIAGPKKKVDKKVRDDKTYKKNGKKTQLTGGTYCRSVNGNPEPPDCLTTGNGAKSQLGGEDTEIPGRTSLKSSLNLPGDSIQLIGEFDPDLGSFTGTIAVPEPFSVAGTTLVLGGGLALLARRAYRGGRRCSRG